VPGDLLLETEVEARAAADVNEMTKAMIARSNMLMDCIMKSMLS
jgi:hypothetical protein